MLFFSQNVFHTFCNNSGMRVILTQIKFKLNVSKNRNEERENGQSFLELHSGLLYSYFSRKIANKMLNSGNRDKPMRSIKQVSTAHK